MYMKRVLSCAAAILLLGLAVAPAARQDVKPEKKASNKQLEVRGIVKSQNGSPVVGKTVYFFPIKDGRISATFRMRGGTSTGVENPSAQTDKSGLFKIGVGLGLVEGGQEFTVGIFDQIGRPQALLSKEGIPLTFRITPESVKDSKTTKKIDLGQITLQAN